MPDEHIILDSEPVVITVRRGGLKASIQLDAFLVQRTMHPGVLTEIIARSVQPWVEQMTAHVVKEKIDA